MTDVSPDPAPEREPDDADLQSAVDRFLDHELKLFGKPQPLSLPVRPAGDGLRPGGTIGGYELVRRLGIGGMGVVFEARQRSLAGRRVAVKILRNAFASEALEQRFSREVATVAELDHPAIVPIVDARVEQGTPYYVMKFIEGLSLAQLIARLRQRARQPEATEDIRTILRAETVQDASSVGESASSESASSNWDGTYARWIARVGQRLAEALHYAQQRGFVHRDVKPGNIMITARGDPVLLDFGLATGNQDDSLTRSGEFLGTAAYAAPEQLEGEAVDGRADVYSLGATLYELLTLNRPYEAPNRTALLRRMEREDPQAPESWVPADLRTIVLTALAQAPGRRYPTPGAMANDLDCFLAGRPIRARAPGLPERLARRARRYPRLVAAVAAVVLALAAVRVADHLAARARVANGMILLDGARAEIERWNHLVDRYASLKSGDPIPFRELAPLKAQIKSSAQDAEQRSRQAEGELRRAFDSVGRFGPARAGLADLEALRLRQALRTHADMLRPDELRQAEDALRRMDREDRFGSLLNHAGSVRIRSAQGPASLQIWTADSAHRMVFRGTTSESPIALPEGSYSARASLPGFKDILLHLLVRRDVCYEATTARPAQVHDLAFLKPDEVPPGFVQIPAGDVLVEDDPPRWEFVQSFMIQEHEVTNGMFLDWTRDLGQEFSKRLGLPEIEGRPYVRLGDSGELQLGLGQKREHPVRGLSPMVMSGYASYLGRIRPPGRPDRTYSLPTAAELIRAGRGADGRRFPWGSEFRYDACANYLSTAHHGMDAAPVEVKSFTADVSPFGVFDLAGSVAEATRDLFAPLPGHYCVLGGSFRSTESNELTFTHARGLRNGPRADVGFRLVLRTLPAALRGLDSRPELFEDRFDRPDSDRIGNLWIQTIGDRPLVLRTNPTSAHGSEIRAGKLVCRSGTGDFSESSSAWHRIHVAASGWRVTAAMTGHIGAQFSDWASKRSYGLVFTNSFRLFEADRIYLKISHGDEQRLELLFRSARGEHASAECPLDGSPEQVEIACRGSELTARAWSVGATRPAVPQLTCRLPTGFQRARFVGFTVPIGGGARAELDWIRVEPGP